MYGASRIITGVARDHLLPPGLATVHARLRTPWVALLLQVNTRCCLDDTQAQYLKLVEHRQVLAKQGTYLEVQLLEAAAC
jgi:hypothetical protein